MTESSAPSQKPNTTLASDRKGTPIEYKEFLKHDGYVTGIAYFTNPQGLGNFRISVSGPPEAVDRFAAEASIAGMQIAPATDQDFAELLDRQAEACRQQNKTLTATFEALKKLSDAGQVANLPEDERRNLFRAAAPARPEHDGAKPNLKRDRLIEIEVLDRLDPKVPYIMRYTVDPSVARGTCDIWKLFTDNVNIAWANMTWTGGDPDLYLYRDISKLAWSTNGSGMNESVFASGGAGEWKLHVYGFSDGSSYEINEISLWYQAWWLGDDIPDTHF